MEFIKYIMFDFDGTIIDSMPFLENNAIDLLTKYYGFSFNEARQKYRNTTGLPFIQQIEIIAPNGSTLNSKVVKKFEEMKIKRIYEQKPFDDSHEVLNKLRKRGYKLGISSGTIVSIITEYLDNEGIKDLVDDILGWKPGFEKGKDHFNHVKSKYNINCSEIVFIGDSLNDAKRALANKILFIGKTGMFTQKDFQQIIPDIRIITTLSELLGDFPPIPQGD